MDKNGLFSKKWKSPFHKKVTSHKVASHPESILRVTLTNLLHATADSSPAYQHNGSQAASQKPLAHNATNFSVNSLRPAV